MPSASIHVLAFAAHYRYEPRPVAIAGGNEKGRVERAFRYVRDSEKTPPEPPLSTA